MRANFPRRAGLFIAVLAILTRCSDQPAALLQPKIIITGIPDTITASLFPNYSDSTIRVTVRARFYSGGGVYSVSAETCPSVLEAFEDGSWKTAVSSGYCAGSSPIVIKTNDGVDATLTFDGSRNERLAPLWKVRSFEGTYRLKLFDRDAPVVSSAFVLRVQ